MTAFVAKRKTPSIPNGHWRPYPKGSFAPLKQSHSHSLVVIESGHRSQQSLFALRKRQTLPLLNEAF
ncbi:hypothetical protein GGQ73_000473 [Rhizobium skierniewicense]|uniref:Uncharacterized protein n=1 Tax=Rhizobium skierniewicense TaxID=984260 RepID=A0A7W6C9W6_9HYPH|nr:hypothetical protein [Rhizobium skierniewicense]